jgi:HEPN domain-containing protein/predicted nucleotidyltransferase
MQPLTTLDAIVERLIEGYQPERIILFGSRAKGTAAPESDYDLLVLKEEPGRPIERRQRVERLLADRRLPLDLLVFTPRELASRFASGSPLVEEVLATGRVLYMRDVTGFWLREAAEELETAAILMDHEKWRGVCFHSQQCAEKVLKALIVEKALPLARTHDLVDLLRRAEGAGWQPQISTDDAVFLNSVYRGRYPAAEGLLPRGEPTREEASRALAAAGRLLTWMGQLDRGR